MHPLLFYPYLTLSTITHPPLPTSSPSPSFPHPICQKTNASLPYSSPRSFINFHIHTLTPFTPPGMRHPFYYKKIGDCSSLNQSHWSKKFTPTRRATWCVIMEGFIYNILSLPIPPPPPPYISPTAWTTVDHRIDIACGNTAVRLISSGMYDNSITFAFDLLADFMTPKLSCPSFLKMLTTDFRFRAK